MAATALCLLLGTPAPLRAASEDWHLQAEVVTDVPVDIGGRIALEFPGRARLSVGLGGLPGGYVSLVNAIVVAAGGYGESTAELIHDSLQRSLVLRVHFGWQPWPEYGFYFEGGYGMLSLGAATSQEDVLTRVTGVKSPLIEELSAGRNYGIESRVHMIDVELGWQWVFVKRVVLRLALGMAGTVGAETSISPRFKVTTDDSTHQYCDRAAHELNAIYRNYVFTPVVSVGLGYRFF